MGPDAELPHGDFCLRTPYPAAEQPPVSMAEELCDISKNNTTMPSSNKHFEDSTAVESSSHSLPEDGSAISTFGCHTRSWFICNISTTAH